MTNPTPQPFTGWLHEQRNGALHHDLSEALLEVVAAVEDTGKAGTLTLTIKVEPATKGQGGVVAITDDVKTKLPQLDRGAAIWFVTSDHELSRNDPRQLALPLREVPRPDTDDLKDASDA